MIGSLQPLESSLNDVLAKKAPALPEGGKKWLVQYLPWINLFMGLATLYTAWVLWHWAHYANALVNYANSISAVYGGPTVIANRMDAGIWLGLIVLFIEAGLYLAAFPATRDRKKSGWDLLFYAALVNIAYGVVLLFSDYGSFGTLVGSVIASAIGLYLLFQIRASYLKRPAAKPKKA